MRCVLEKKISITDQEITPKKIVYSVTIVKWLYDAFLNFFILFISYSVLF